MTAHVIRFCAKLSPARGLRPPQGGRLKEGYCPARLGHAPKAQGGSDPAPSILRHSYVANVHTVNNILLRVSFFPAGAPGGTHRPVLPAGAGTVRAFAGAFLDCLLRREIERQIALMKRGENIGENQLRRRSLGRYLAAGHYRVLRRFYSVQLLHYAKAACFPQEEPFPFQTDIITERRTQITKNTYEQHNSTQILRPGGEAEETRSASAIADQVFQRVQRKMRLDRERSGRFW